jgi:hypothetical protein
MEVSLSLRLVLNGRAAAGIFVGGGLARIFVNPELDTECS